MAENVGSVFWEVEVDTSGMLRGVRQMDRQLDNFNGQLNQTSQSIRNAFNPARVRRLAGGVAKAVGAATLAFTAFAAAIGQSGKELEVMARQAGVTVEEIQAISFATEKYTVSGEQFADITKDMSDKLGEFAAVGTGPFQDYIDVMGMTKDAGRDLAKQLQNLSGPQAIQFLVSEMERVGTTGAQMTFVLESMGNDLSKLAPLFSENGKELDGLTKKFKELSGGIDADTFKEYKELAGNMGLATSSFKTFLAEALSPLIPAFNDASVSIAKFFSELTKSTKESQKSADINDRIAEIIGKQLDRRGRVVKIASKEADEINKLLLLNEKLNSKVDERIQGIGRSAVQARKNQAENSTAWKAEIAANDKIIQQLKEQSAAAEDVFNLRNGIEPKAPLEVAVTPKIQKSQGPFEGIGDPFSSFGEQKEGEEGAFGVDDEFNLQQLGRLEAFKNAEEEMTAIAEIESQKRSAFYDFALESVSRGLAQAVIAGDDFNETLKTIGRSILTELLANMIKVGVKQAVLFATGETQKAVATGTSVAAGAATAAAWAPAAAAVSLASFGANAAPASAGISATTGFAFSALSAGVIGSGRAQGGPVKAGNIYPVNEAGTEGFQFRSGGKDYLQPMTDGKVVKNSDMKKGGGGDSFSISNSYTIQALDTTTAAQFIEQNQEAVYQSVINAANERGGF